MVLGRRRLVLEIERFDRDLDGTGNLRIHG
jgi:hypothetical protein